MLFCTRLWIFLIPEPGRSSCFSVSLVYPFKHSLPFGRCHMSPRTFELHHCSYVLLYFKCLPLAYLTPSWNSVQRQLARGNTSRLSLAAQLTPLTHSPSRPGSCTQARSPQADQLHSWPSPAQAISVLLSQLLLTSDFLTLKRPLLLSSRLKKKKTDKQTKHLS